MWIRSACRRSPRPPAGVRGPPSPGLWWTDPGPSSLLWGRAAAGAACTPSFLQHFPTSPQNIVSLTNTTDFPPRRERGGLLGPTAQRFLTQVSDVMTVWSQQEVRHVPMTVRLSLCLSFSPSVSLPLFQPVCLCPSFSLPVSQSLVQSICLSASFPLSTFVSISLSLSVCPSLC